VQVEAFAVEIKKEAQPGIAAKPSSLLPTIIQPESPKEMGCLQGERDITIILIRSAWSGPANGQSYRGASLVLIRAVENDGVKYEDLQGCKVRSRSWLTTSGELRAG
jgi:hypothetical protein